ncbi:hypothetical protein [Ornithinibacillus halophilus]|uniref:Uncharacterized protein n=1 Tax=Ornithinibacillus halophilus TaxID=930117 RepID=A0A1M5HT88_9BACI|nr:hypothetical protein [Ornithinibacillus halophilus]SHG19181.1 hypothetical protein SAMN05216225_101945 [Ornithinibacillus halophilus]
MLYWIIGLIILLIIIEETIYYVENRILFGKRKSRIMALIAKFQKKSKTQTQDVPIYDEPRQRRSR